MLRIRIFIGSYSKGGHTNVVFCEALSLLENDNGLSMPELFDPLVPLALVAEYFLLGGSVDDDNTLWPALLYRSGCDRAAPSRLQLSLATVDNQE